MIHKWGVIFGGCRFAGCRDCGMGDGLDLYNGIPTTKEMVKCWGCRVVKNEKETKCGTCDLVENLGL